MLQPNHIRIAFLALEIALVAAIAYAYAEGAYAMLAIYGLYATVAIHAVCLLFYWLGMHQLKRLYSGRFKRPKGRKVLASIGLGLYFLVTVFLIIITIAEGMKGFQKTFQ